MTEPKLSRRLSGVMTYALRAFGRGSEMERDEEGFRMFHLNTDGSWRVENTSEELWFNLYGRGLIEIKSQDFPITVYAISKVGRDGIDILDKVQTTT